MCYSMEQLWKTLDCVWAGQTWRGLVIRVLFVGTSLCLHDSYVTMCYFGLIDRLLLKHKYMLK